MLSAIGGSTFIVCMYNMLYAVVWKFDGNLIYAKYIDIYIYVPSGTSAFFWSSLFECDLTM